MYSVSPPRTPLPPQVEAISSRPQCEKPETTGGSMPLCEHLGTGRTGVRKPDGSTASEMLGSGSPVPRTGLRRARSARAS